MPGSQQVSHEVTFLWVSEHGSKRTRRRVRRAQTDSDSGAFLMQQVLPPDEVKSRVGCFGCSESAKS